MTLYELIQILNNIKEKQGNIPVAILDNHSAVPPRLQLHEFQNDNKVGLLVLILNDKK